MFGLISGFFSPAASSMVPHIVGKESLQADNSLIQGTVQLSNFVGPVLAGGLIALFSNGNAGAMSLVLFANLGLIPVSQTLSGMIIKFSMAGLFLGAGILMVCLAAWMAINRLDRPL